MSRFLARTVVLATYLTSASAPLNAETKLPVYAYDVEYRSAEINAIARIDPSKPRGNRVTIFEPIPERQPDWLAQEIDTIDANPMEDFWCSDFGTNIPDNLAFSNLSDGTEKLEFQPVSDEPGTENVIRHMRGEAIRDSLDGELLSFRLFNEKPFKPEMIVKIQNFDLQVTCLRSPDGRTYAASQSTRVSGSAAFRSFEDSETTLISNLKRVN